MEEQNVLSEKKNTECKKDIITLDGENLLYSLSNSLDDIEIAIFSRTGQNINLKNTYWKLNTNLFIGVKYLMNKHQVRYSMTISNINNRKDLVINMRVNDRWFITRFTEIDGSFHSWDFLEKKALLEKLLEEQSKTSKENKLSTDSEKNTNITIDKFITDIDLLFRKRKDEDLTFEELLNALFKLIEQYKNLKLCKEIINYNLDKNDFFLLMCFCHLYINNNDDRIGFNDLKPFYENRIIVHEIIRSLSEYENILVKNNFIECNNSKDSSTSETWRLSEKTKKELFSIIPQEVQQKNYRNNKNLILFESIKNKKMFYNAKENEAVQTLTALLQEENYHNILDRLDAKGMRKGFACLFSGEPGTGKTETALQIARETKRNIMKVDISETKSYWVGESEKNIKEVFDNYHDIVKNSKTTPILLLNEADGIIHKRKELDAKSGAADKSDNAVQNIILEEMENFSGIIIATSNLIKNIDSAFERRFLYKITFDKPDAESRKGIWNVLLPDLPEHEALELSRSFELSGGQIENVARKVEVDSILKGSVPSLDTLLQYCKDENTNCFNTSKKIGF